MVNPSHKLAKEMKAMLTIGDWSGDGHGHFEKIYYMVNYPVADIQQAYKDSCKTTGIQFNRNKNYTGVGGKMIYDQILTAYENNQIRPKEVEILRKHKVITDEWLSGHSLVEQADAYITLTEAEDVADLVMRFISLSMPNDFVYIKVENEVEPINGWWDKNLNCQFGYGIYQNAENRKRHYERRGTGHE